MNAVRVFQKQHVVATALLFLYFVRVVPPSNTTAMLPKTWFLLLHNGGKRASVSSSIELFLHCCVCKLFLQIFSCSCCFFFYYIQDDNELTINSNNLFFFFHPLCTIGFCQPQFSQHVIMMSIKSDDAFKWSKYNKQCKFFTKRINLSYVVLARCQILIGGVQLNLVMSSYKYCNAVHLIK